MLQVIQRCIQFICIGSLIILLSCNEHSSIYKITNANGKNDCRILKELITENKIKVVEILRPYGHEYDTTYHSIMETANLYGERLFTYGNEKFQCSDIDSVVCIEKDTLKINYKIAGYDNSGPFTQEFVDNFWESGNGYLLNKKLPSFKGYSFAGDYLDLDSLIAVNDKTIIHFGWLNCQGCMKEQAEIVELEEQGTEYKFVNVTIDSKKKLTKYLKEQGQMYELQSPFNNISKKMIKPILYDDKSKLFNKFYLKGVFPVNFLVDNSGTVKKIGSIMELTSEDEVEIIRID